MTSIATVSRAGKGGVFRLDEPDLDEVERRAAAAGLTPVRIDLSQARGKEGALVAFARALSFPEWFGGNWDALQDSLADLSWLDAKGWALVVDGADALAASSPGDLATLIDVLRAAARAWRKEGRSFVALLRGERLPRLPSIRSA